MFRGRIPTADALVIIHRAEGVYTDWLRRPVAHCWTQSRNTIGDRLSWYRCSRLPITSSEPNLHGKLAANQRKWTQIKVNGPRTVDDGELIPTDLRSFAFICGKRRGVHSPLPPLRIPQTRMTAPVRPSRMVDGRVRVPHRPARMRSTWGPKANRTCRGVRAGG